MTAYKTAPGGTTDKVADGTVLPVDGLETAEVDLDQPGTTTKPVKMLPSRMCQDFRGICCPPVNQ